MSIDEPIAIAARVLGFAVFAFAVAGKLRHRDEFLGVVANYRVVPAAAVATIAWAVVLAEIVVALSFATGFSIALGASLAIFLLAAFAVAIGVNLRRGRTEIDCGCFQSALRQRLRPALVVRNLLLIASLAPLLLTAREDVPPTAFDLLNGVAAGVALSVIYFAFGELLSLSYARGAPLRTSS